MFSFMTYFGEDKIWQLQTCLCHSLASILPHSFLVGPYVFFPAVSLRRVRPSYGTFSLKVFQGNCARGRTGHMIIIPISKTKADHFTRNVSIPTGIGYKSSLCKPIDILCIKSFKSSTTQKYLKIPSNYSSKGLYRFKRVFNMGRTVNP